MFRIKICGITEVADAIQAFDAGADALGFNFYAKSPRCVSVKMASSVSTSVQLRWQLKHVNLVGVFVNASPRDKFETGLTAKLNSFQLHGDEPPEQVADDVKCNAIMHFKRPWRIIRAFRCREPNLASASEYLRQCSAAGGLPQAVLLDAYAPNAFGGTGQVVDWNVVRNEREKLFGLPVILAGGLTPDNVAAAIRIARPDAVDVASGVESSPGKKDPSKVRDFIAAAKGAFEEIQSLG